MLTSQAKVGAAAGEVRAGAGPGVSIQRDGVVAALAGNHPGAGGQDHHLHLAALQGSPRPGRAFVLELVLQDWGCGSHRVLISLLSCQKTNVWGLVSDVGWESHERLPNRRLPPDVPHFRARQGSKPRLPISSSRRSLLL